MIRKIDGKTVKVTEVFFYNPKNLLAGLYCAFCQRKDCNVLDKNIVIECDHYTDYTVTLTNPMKYTSYAAHYSVTT